MSWVEGKPGALFQAIDRFVVCLHMVNSPGGVLLDRTRSAALAASQRREESKKLQSHEAAMGCPSP